MSNDVNGRVQKHGLVIVLAMLLTGCAQLTELVEQEMCSRDAAYAAGVNAGRTGHEMASNFSWGCPLPEGLNEAYREGYQFGLAHAGGSNATNAAPTHQCVSSFGQQVCGYHCKQSGTTERCAATPDQQCVKDDFGAIACGYGCVKTSTSVGCAEHRSDNCVSDIVGNIKCGRNCRVEYASLKCDKKDKKE